MIGRADRKVELFTSIKLEKLLEAQGDSLECHIKIGKFRRVEYEMEL